MNILITAIGSMSAISVIESVKKKSAKKIVGCDINEKKLLPASSYVDIFYKVPKVSKKNFIYIIKKICKNEKITHIFPLTDIEIDFFNKNRKKFNKLDLKICMPSKKTISICRDKFLLYNFFKDEKKIKTIKSCKLEKKSIEEKNFPMIIKPRDGRSSQGVMVIENNIDLEYAITKKTNKNYIIQPLICGKIITVDVIRDIKNKRIAAIARKELIRTKNGAGISIQLYNSVKLTKIVTKIVTKLNLNGFINIEFINNNNKFYLMDINPRFSGGINFSKIAGYDMTLNTLKLHNEKKIKKQIEYKDIFINKFYTDLIQG